MRRKGKGYLTDMKKRIVALLLALCFCLPAFAAAEIPDDLFTSEETVLDDREGGHWAYSNDVLSIRIERHNVNFVPLGESREKPLVYYVAHIYMRKYSSFRPGFGDDAESGRGISIPSKVCRKYRAVLGITGDNIIQAEANLKGALIRNGRVYSDCVGEAVMAMKDDMTMEIFEKGTIRAEQLLEMGVRNTYSFGPWLIKDGVENEAVRRFRVNRVNPRVGIGMIEPGHFVAIVVDGRQGGYSYGLSLPEFADLFVAEGCTQAFNLDGGCSTGMVFMGEHLNRHDGPGSADYQRFWPDAILFGYSELVPGVDDPLLHDGNREDKR